MSWDLTHSAAWVGAISLAQVLPLISFSAFFGVLLDRHSHRAYALLVNGLAAVLAAVLYILTAAQWMNIHILLVFAILLGTANSAYQAGRLTLVNDIVRPNLVPQAIAITSVLFNLSRALGPAVVGLLIARFGIASVFAANAISFIAILGALAVIEMRPVIRHAVYKSVLQETREGLSYAATHPQMRGFLALAAITSILVRGSLELLPAYAAAVFARGIAGLAELNTSVGVGAITGALVLSHAKAGSRLVPISRSATIALGLIVASFGLSRSYPVALAMMGAFGFAVVLSSVGLQTLLQATLEERYRGRMLGVWSAVNIAGPGVGAAVLGALAQSMGLMPVAVISGLLCTTLVLLLIRRGRFTFGRRG
jgi:predicted MFS family arabinose efflux permease